MADAVDRLTEQTSSEDQKLEAIETQEWLESLDWVLGEWGAERVVRLLNDLESHAVRRGVHVPVASSTPFVNTIPPKEEVSYPGNRELERRIKSFIRWNAMAIVVRANKRLEGIGGHISTYASTATLYEVGFNHFFRGPDAEDGPDMVYFQGHAAPGVYARAYLEGRLSENQVENFRRELADGGGVSSYPHPWLMPDFWEFPTVSMGLGPLMAVYQARFQRYLENRGLIEPSGRKVWAFLGDGETDEPESLAGLSLAAHEKLDNLIFVVNCNLQRLDGPVRGNAKIIQELEGQFRGAGWNVIKVIWGSDWNALLEKDKTGLLMRRMREAVDGDFQKYAAESGEYVREHFFGKYPELLELVEHLSDEQLATLRRGGHDPVKVFNAFKRATEYEDGPTAILCHTIKGYGLGEAGEARNVTHQQKKLEKDQILYFRDRFSIPLSDSEAVKLPFYKPEEDTPESRYLLERREKLGGFLPQRRVVEDVLTIPSEEDLFAEFYGGTEGREASTTMVFVRILAKLLRDKQIGERIVPIIPDEARTFGMEALFSQVGIYSGVGQKYEPVDKAGLMYYKEAREGQILEEGITEAGSMCSFIAAGTAQANMGKAMIPFYIFYSMFGFQRVGDFIWAAGDIRCRGFLLGATAGRTTLNGEGLQHEDGNSHLLAYPYPKIKAYDPAFAYEISVIVQKGLREMYVDQKDCIYYLTLGNENYEQPPMPEGEPEEIKDGILGGLYRYKQASNQSERRVDLFGSGAILPGVIKAQEVLADDFTVAADVWSVTSYKELHLEALETERWNLLHPGEEPRKSFISRQLEGSSEIFVAASDYVKALPESISKWLPGRLISLGTDGFGRSDSRAALRDFFEVDYRHIVVAALVGLMEKGEIKPEKVKEAMKKFEIDPEKESPLKL